MTPDKAAPNPIPLRTDSLPDDHKLQVQFALGAFGCVMADEIAYVSVAVTSGKRLYEYMDKMGFKTPDEAKKDRKAFFENVISPNIEEGVKLSQQWSKKVAGAVIAHAEFEKCRGLKGTKWGQDAFMGMWLGLIDDKVTKMVMSDGWQYSDGAGEEYLQAMLMKMGRRGRNNVEVTDAQGAELTLDKGVQMIWDAFQDLRARGLKPRNMVQTLACLLSAELRYSVEQDYGQSAEPSRESYAVDPNMKNYDRAPISAIAKQMRQILADEYPDIRETVRTHTSFEFSPINALFRKQEKLPENVGLVNAAKPDDAVKPQGPKPPVP
ncbi:MAG: hypothetical protein ACAH83_16890 [Alphaproteobacteria bacterium]